MGNRMNRTASSLHSSAAARVMALGQGWFWLVSGLWPIVHIGSFMAVTGPKTDTWLVQTVGGLLAVIGAGLLLAARRGAVSPEVRFIAAASALVLVAIDVIFVWREVIGPIYLADAAVELAIAIGWWMVRPRVDSSTR